MDITSNNLNSFFLFLAEILIFKTIIDMAICVSSGDMETHFKHFLFLRVLF